MNATTFTVDSMPLVVALSLAQADSTGPFYFKVSTTGKTNIQNLVVSAVAVSGDEAISGNFTVGGTAGVTGKISGSGALYVSAIASLEGAIVGKSTFTLAGIASLDGAVNVGGQLNPAVTVNFIPAVGKLGFQTTVFASANVSAGLWIEAYTSGGTKIYIPARTAVP